MALDGTSGVAIGNVLGNISDSLIAGRDIIVNRLFYDDRAAARALDKLRQGLKDNWLDSLLAESLEGGPFLLVRLTDRPDFQPKKVAVPFKSGITLESVGQPRIRGGTDSLLLLGSAGSGKTTLLLQAAKAQHDSQSIQESSIAPVFLTLAGWTVKDRLPRNRRDNDPEQSSPFAQWLIKQISRAYEIPEYFVRRWMLNGDLTIFLDGLDEVPRSSRNACVAAINQLLETSLCTFVISSRTEDYSELQTKLAAKRVAEIEPLSPEQVEQYIDSQPTAAKLQLKALAEQEDFRELLKSPLMLSILAVTIKGTGSPLDLDGEPFSVTVDQIFAAHTGAMFNRERAANTKLDRNSILLALRSIARYLSKEAKTQFEVERISWTMLMTSKGRACFRIIHLLLTAALLVSIGITGLLLGYFDPFSAWKLPVGLGVIASIIIYSWILFYGKDSQSFDSLSFDAKRAIFGFLIGGVAGTVVWPIWAVVATIIPALLTVLISFALAKSVLLLLTVVVVLIILIIAWFRMVNNGFSSMWYSFLGLLWVHAIPGFVASIALWLGGASNELLKLLPGGFDATSGPAWFEVSRVMLRISLVVGIALAFPGFLIGGIQIKTSNARSRPGAALVATLLNSLALCSAAICCAQLILILSHRVFGEHGIARHGYGFFTICVGLVAFAIGKGPIVIQNLILRGLLAAEGTLPLRLLDILDEAVRCVLLRRITSGFLFLHKIQLEYFASMSDDQFSRLLDKVEKCEPHKMKS